jgi:hypothetical protein
VERIKAQAVVRCSLHRARYKKFNLVSSFGWLVGTWYGNSKKKTANNETSQLRPVGACAYSGRLSRQGSFPASTRIYPIHGASHLTLGLPLWSIGTWLTSTIGGENQGSSSSSLLASQSQVQQSKSGIVLWLVDGSMISDLDKVWQQSYKKWNQSNKTGCGIWLFRASLSSTILHRLHAYSF